jgi:2,3-bisphosphoglycerate-independent phosphoglycerate mutase
MPNPGSHPANSPVMRLVTRILKLATQRLRNRNKRSAVAAIATAKGIAMLIGSDNIQVSTSGKTKNG